MDNKFAYSIEKQTAYGMIWLRHIIGLIHIDKIIGEVLERQHCTVVSVEVGYSQ